ncbi:MAG: Gmad2 immunoglobulin-like domain-containing protein [Nocardioides sp.]|nr:Gmad2 immunoglobulin-like domain-containing protein [Nocardioides sp.]
MTTPHDDALSRLVSDAVNDVEPADRLDEIRARTAETSTSRRRLFIAGGTVLAAAAAVVAIAMVTVVLNDPAPVPSPTDDPTRIVDTPPTAETVAVPAYYVGDTGRGLRLFREFVNVEEGPNPVASVLGALESTPGDPDYRTLWPAGAFAGGEVRDDVIHVVIADAALHDRPASMTEAEAALAIEQVIFSVQGAVGDRLAVQFRLGVNPVDEVLGQPTSEPLSNADPVDVLSLMSVTYPYEGAVVSGSFVAEGVNNGHEATMNWSLVDADGDVVLEGYATAEGWMDALYPWETDPIDVSGLAAGTYTFVAVNPDPSGGDGFAPDTDTRSITVE